MQKERYNLMNLSIMYIDTEYMFQEKFISKEEKPFRTQAKKSQDQAEEFDKKGIPRI